MYKEQKNRVQTILKTGDDNTPSGLNGYQRLRECCFILGLLIALFLAVSLYGFDPADPSWSQTSWDGEVHNAAGTFGAWVADTLFFGFGSLAYSIPAVVAVMTWGLFRTREADDAIDLMLWGTRILGLTIVILTSCGLADINFDDIWYFSSGGVIGDVLTSLALPTLNVLGSTIVFLFLWGAGLTLLTGISWLAVVEWLGTVSIDASAWLLNVLRGTPKEKLVAVDHLADESDDYEADFVPTVGLQTEASIQERRYNIHMPQKRDDSALVTRQTEHEAVNSVIERSLQLNATIAELEQDAIAHGDLALTVGRSVVDTQPREQVPSAPSLAELAEEEKSGPSVSLANLD